jgi:hypothetical protein
VSPNPHPLWSGSYGCISFFGSPCINPKAITAKLAIVNNKNNKKQKQSVHLRIINGPSYKD